MTLPCSSGSACRARQRLRCAVLIFGAALCAATGHAQAANGTVRGTVFLDDTGLPATGSNVFLLPPPAVANPPITYPHELIMREPRSTGEPAIVDAAGAYAIRNVPPGSYDLIVYREGYLSAREFIYPGAFSPEITGIKTALPGFVRHVTITPGSVLRENLRLERGGSIEGRVLLSDGTAPPLQTSLPSPVPGVAVNVAVKGANGHYSRYGGASHAAPDGGYRIDALAPGEYIVFSGLPGRMVQTGRGLTRAGGPVIYAPGVIRPSEARVVFIAGASTHVARVDLTLPAANLHTIRGRVLAPGGRPITGDLGDLLLRLVPSGEDFLAQSVPAHPDGSFDFDQVQDGRYTLTAAFSPQPQPPQILPDGSGIRTVLNRPRFANVQVEVVVAGSDPPAAILEPAPQ